MATKSFKGRPLLAGDLKGEALASKQPFNVSSSYLENLFGGNTKSAPRINEIANIMETTDSFLITTSPPADEKRYWVAGYNILSGYIQWIGAL